MERSLVSNAGQVSVIQVMQLELTGYLQYWGLGLSPDAIGLR